MLLKEKPEHWQPAFSVATALIQHEERFLFLKRSAQETMPLMWGVPGGTIEKGETPLQAVVREVKEETGIELIPADLKEPHLFHVRISKKGLHHGVDLDYFLFHEIFDIQPDIQLMGVEHTEFAWVTLEEAGELHLVHDMLECLQTIFAK